MARANVVEKRAVRPKRPSARNPGRLAVKASHPRPPASAESKALGAMLGSERWYPVAAEHIVKAFYATDGNAVQTARALGVSWRSLRDWCALYPELQRSLDAARAGKRGPR